MPPSRTLESPSLVLGSTVARLPDLAAGETATVDVALRTDAQQFGQSIAGPVVGQPSYDNDGSVSTTSATRATAMINQLTYDPDDRHGQSAPDRRRRHPCLGPG